MASQQDVGTTAFWNAPSTWPDDGPENIFLARAVHAFGHSVFGANWTRSEPLAQPIVSVPDDWRLATNREALHVIGYLRLPNSFAENLRTAAQKELSKIDGALADAPADLRHLRPLTNLDELWKAAAHAASEHDTSAASPAKRWQVVIETMKQKLGLGEIIMYTRPIEGGEFEALPTSAWNTERWQQRLNRCEMNRSQPFALPDEAPATHYLYFRRIDVPLVMAQPAFPVRPIEIENWSPYMKLAVQVIRDMNLNVNHSVPKASVRAEVDARWEQFELPPSDVAQRTMAMFLRHPDDQKGKAKKIRARS